MSRLFQPKSHSITQELIPEMFTTMVGVSQWKCQFPGIITRRSKKSMLYSLIWYSTKEMMKKTKFQNERLLRDKYKPPHVLTKEYNENLRKEKEDLAEMKDEFMKQTNFELPRSTKERVEAVVFKKMYEH